MVSEFGWGPGTAEIEWFYSTPEGIVDSLKKYCTSEELSNPLVEYYLNHDYTTTVREDVARYVKDLLVSKGEYLIKVVWDQPPPVYGIRLEDFRGLQECP